MRRPIGVTLIAAYCVLAGLAIVLQSVQGAILEGAGLGFQLAGAASFALGMFELMAAYGLVTLAPWGRVLAIVVFGASIVLVVTMLLVATVSTPLWIAFRVFDLAVAAAIIAYLMQKRIRDLFAVGAAATTPRP
jgi:hypothetical protein